jgi:hypothetical protein
MHGYIVIRLEDMVNSGEQEWTMSCIMQHKAVMAMVSQELMLLRFDIEERHHIAGIWYRLQRVRLMIVSRATD